MLRITIDYSEILDALDAARLDNPEDPVQNLLGELLLRCESYEDNGTHVNNRSEGPGLG
jgi:hypothetical protein